MVVLSFKKEERNTNLHIIMKVSIIIPVYNVQAYIKRCISCVLNQTYRELEVILIDDCSTDKSMQIAKEMINSSNKSQDLNWTFIRHETNKGIASTRNTGLKNIHGDYFFFLDSDDEITPDCIESFVAIAYKYPGVDIIQGETCQTDNNKLSKKVSTNNLEYTNDNTLVKQLMFSDGSPVGISNVVWNKLVKSSIIREYNMWFKDGLVAEDVYWLLMYWRFISSVAFNHKETYYYYNDNPTSITNESIQRYRHFFSKMETFKDFIPIIDPHDRYIYRDIIGQLHHFGKIMRTENNPQRYIGEYRKTIKQLLTCNHLPCRVKMVLRYLLFPDFFVRNKIIKILLK